MYNIKLMNKIAPCGTKLFDQERYTCSDEVSSPDALLVRSASLHEMEFSSHLKAIARAGAGVNNIPLDRCSEAGIVVFNTPGANANAVKELVITALLLASRKVVQGIEWVKTLKGEGEALPKLVEKGKSQFAGPEIQGKTLGIIGLGAIGVMVANTAHHLGMDVLGYDPYISVDAAWNLSRFVHRATDIAEIFEKCDYITVHVPLNNETRGMFSADAFATMKQGVRIINFSRGELVDTADMKAALESGKVAAYVTDFPSEEVLELPNTIALPHIGASTPESENNCAVLACRELIDYVENGNIKNSVNMAELLLPKSEHKRICVLHKNIPNVLNNLTSVVSGSGINIENLYNKSKKDNAYTIVEIDGDVPSDCLTKISAIEGVLRVRAV